MSEEITLRDLQMMASSSTPHTVMLGMMLATTHEQRLDLVEKAVDFAIREMIKVPQHYQEFSEDELTNSLINFLLGMGLHPTHDQQIGGHCDIVIQFDNGFLWIGEAKKHGAYDWLVKGFNQLDTRYSTGMPGQDSGDLIIFIFQERIDQVMDRWAAALAEQRPDVVTEPCQSNPTYLISTHTHSKTGRPFKVRHIPVPLLFAPQDRA